MLQIFLHSMRLFFRGKLFRDNRAVLLQWLKGFALTLLVLVAIGFIVSPILGIVIASLAGGAAQPWLFKDLKYN